MHHSPKSVSVLLLFLLSSGIIAAAENEQQTSNEPGKTQPPRHLIAARELVQCVDLKHTNYEHGEGHVTWSGTCASHTDCSGFIDELLIHSYGYDREQFKTWFDSHRPSARRYFDAIQSERGFQEVKRVQDLHPGDILAAKYLKRKDNTGHVMLVAGHAREMQSKKPIVEGTRQWEVKIIDSSESGHGPTDTRHKKGPDGKDHDGLGEGVLRLYSDGGGAIVGFAWSTLSVSAFKGPDDEPIVAGRLKPNFKP